VYFLLIYRLNFYRGGWVALRVVACLLIAWMLTELKSAIVFRSLLATGWFPVFEFHSLVGIRVGSRLAYFLGFL